jgi:hypothetical protein
VYKESKVVYAARLEKLLANNAKVRNVAVQCPFPLAKMKGRPCFWPPQGGVHSLEQCRRRLMHAIETRFSLSWRTSARAGLAAGRRGMDHHSGTSGDGR